MSRRVLVTGAGGFIGSHLVEALLARGDRVRAMVRYNARGDRGALEELPKRSLSEVDVVAGDLTDPFFVRGAVHGMECVFHLGAIIAIPYSYRSPAQVFSTNTMGTLYLAQACLDADVSRLVHTSTSEVYGSAQSVPITESHPLVGQSPYSASKIAADKCVESFHRSFKLPAVTIRPFNTYGPRQSARAIVPAILTQLFTRAELHLGALSPTRDLNFVTDTAAGFVLASETVNAIGRTLNLATGREISIGELALKCMKIVGKTLPVVCDEARLRPAESEVERLCGDASEAHALLGFEPKVTLDEGIARVAEYLRENLERFRPEEYIV